MEVPKDPQKYNELSQFIHSLSLNMDDTGQKWFMCFGTLLFLCRDKIFNMAQDIDIGVIGDANVVINVLNNAYMPVDKVLNDVTKNPLKVTYMCEQPKIMIDIFFWKKIGSMYYHVEPMENPIPKSGILSSYKFKGVPADCFEMDDDYYDGIKRDSRYEGAPRKTRTWDGLIKGFESEGFTVALPRGYGNCLDIWYPHWLIRRENFGTSMARQEITVSSCKDLK